MAAKCMALLFLAAACCAQVRRPRIAIGGLSAEFSSLYPRKLVMREFNLPPREQWMQEVSKTSTVASGAVEAAQHLGLDLFAVVQGGTGSLGHVEAASFSALLDKLVAQIKNASPSFDGAILIDHGAMVVEGYPHGDAEVARRLRQTIGKDFPIVVTQDFHANIAPELTDNSRAVIGYKQNPHLDTSEPGIQAATIMAGMVSGKLKPVQALAKPPMLLNILYQDTFHGLLKPIVDETRRLDVSAGLKRPHFRRFCRQQGRRFCR